MRKYKLKLSKACEDYLISKCREHKIIPSFGATKEFGYGEIGGDKNKDPHFMGGMTLSTARNVYLLISDYQMVGGFHDLIALHELGHALFKRAGVLVDEGHEEIMADGFAVGICQSYGFKINKKILEAMVNRIENGKISVVLPIN